MILTKLIELWEETDYEVIRKILAQSVYSLAVILDKKDDCRLP